MTTHDSSRERASRAPLVAGFTRVAGMSVQTAVAGLLLARAPGIALSTAPGTPTRSRASAAPLGYGGGPLLAMFLGFAPRNETTATVAAVATPMAAWAIVERTACESA